MCKKNQENRLFTSNFVLKIGFFICFILFLNTIKSQSDDFFSDNFRIGVRLGVNSTSLRLSENLSAENYNSNSKMGFYGGGVLYIPLSSHFVPMAEIGFETINSSVNYVNNFSLTANTEKFNGDISLKYLSLGLCPNFVFAVNHVNFNVYGGFHVSFMTSAREIGTYERVYIDTINNQTTTIKTEVDGKNKLLSETVDSGFLTGFGFEYKINDRMAIHADSRFRFGTNMIVNSYKSRSWGVIIGLVYAL